MLEMEESYLALHWNNHNTIFTKILNLLREQEAYTDVSLACEGRTYPAHKFVLSTCSEYFKEIFNKTQCKHPVVFMKDVTAKDMEHLLDFMYKGEVHVPQSELGSLLRTAEGLQVKGLAVPDDAPKSLDETICFTDGATSVPSFLMSPTKNSVSTPSLPVKRKRTSDKKENPPRLTPRSQLVKGQRSSGKSTKNQNRNSSLPPQLKRIKTNDNIQNNNNIIHHSGKEILEYNNTEALDCQKNGDDSQSAIALIKNVKVEQYDYDIQDNVGPEETHNGETEIPFGDEKQETINDVGAENSPINHSEVDENSSLPNSEISTAELLQVDLSEDGTRFIIAPGGIGGEASRGSSAGGDEEVTEAQKKPFVCLLCGHTFTRRDNLANHLKTHTGDRPFMCQYCHKCFSRKDYLKQHERIHTGEKPYACEICSRAFTRKEGLTDHMRCHSDFKAFACETCGKSFKQKCGLRFHKRNYKH